MLRIFKNGLTNSTTQQNNTTNQWRNKSTTPQINNTTKEYQATTITLFFPFSSCRPVPWTKSERSSHQDPTEKTTRTNPGHKKNKNCHSYQRNLRACTLEKQLHNTLELWKRKLTWRWWMKKYNGVVRWSRVASNYRNRVTRTVYVPSEEVTWSFPPEEYARGLDLEASALDPKKRRERQKQKEKKHMTCNKSIDNTWYAWYCSSHWPLSHSAKQVQMSLNLLGTVRSPESSVRELFKK